MQKVIETSCYECNSVTHQTPLFLKKVQTIDDRSMSYMVIECGGCKNISFVVREPLTDIIHGENDYVDFNYPTEEDPLYAKYTFLRLEDENRLPKKIYNLYQEVRLVFNTDSNILAGIGLRMLVEAICINQKIPGNTLQDKIKKLHQNGIISTTELPILDKLRLIGNDSTHKIKSFPMNKLSYALDIVNHILKSIYVLPAINKLLKI